jgi:hypothetical protein
MKCPDCNAWLGSGEFDPVTYASPLSHNRIFERKDGRMTGQASKCPTMMARELQIQTEVFGGERAYRWGFTRHPQPSRYAYGPVIVGAFVPPWAGEALPHVTERRYMQTASYS